MNSSFRRLIRFKDENGDIQYGDAVSDVALVGQKVIVYLGQVPWDLKPTQLERVVSEVLCPLPYTPIIYGIGLNYKTHITEAGFPTPEYPTVFTKPPDALNGPFSDVNVPEECLNIDYEGELCAIIGEDCRDIHKDDDPLNYVLGYTCGNDVSSRYWQMSQRSGQQHGYAKSFDGFAPLGPVLVSPSAIPDVSKLTLVTRVNGEERQRASIGDMLFSVGDIIRHLSRGTTLRAGTVIMTGTPSGVAFSSDPLVWLKNGDEVEVEISELGTLRNRHIFK
ncbi:fumarylacetoacetate hydrolase family protein [Zopfia rhizophila CBS 207.26]|uniref:Fumarylacetoacetate hydrolase family protein n=1 Tax=Zopfia rhizophila CBS 207.26 TaxID=1314779 RepID=A0A6A6E6J0_9PEZI|nr:fumarylacetoacetate hydrolase family protein [Zopfia rhizophila CBS 207.26]